MYYTYYEYMSNSNKTLVLMLFFFFQYSIRHEWAFVNTYGVK